MLTTDLTTTKNKQQVIDPRPPESAWCMHLGGLFASIHHQTGTHHRTHITQFRKRTHAFVYGNVILWHLMVVHLQKYKKKHFNLKSERYKCWGLGVQRGFWLLKRGFSLNPSAAKMSWDFHSNFESKNCGKQEHVRTCHWKSWNMLEKLSLGAPGHCWRLLNLRHHLQPKIIL